MKLRTSTLLGLSALAANAAAAERPNIVIILADDLGWANVGFHGSAIQTPNLDALSKKGVVLDRFYNASISSPTRCGLLTGRYPHRLGIREDVIPPWRDFGIAPEETTLPELLATAGYPNRALTGKWHLGHSRRQYYPLENGFTHFYGHLNGAIDYFTHEREGEIDWHNDWETCRDEGYSTDLISREAARCVAEYSKGEPYLLYVAFNAPHEPLQAKPEDIALYAEDIDALKGRKRKEALYAAMVTCMDRGIGDILKAIEASGEADNTFIFFFSDNGAPTNGGGSNLPLRGDKHQEWDGGLRAPAIAYLPGSIEGGRTVTQTLGFIDIMPTVCAMAGVTEQPAKPFDGINILDVLTGRKEEIERDLFLGCGAIVNNHHKFLLPNRNKATGLDEAFLSYYPEDPYETTNCIHRFPQEAARLQAAAVLLDTVRPAAILPPFAQGRENFIAPSEWKIKK